MTDRYCLQYGRLQQAFDDKDAAGRQPSAAFHLTADGALHQVPGIPPLKVGEGAVAYAGDFYVEPLEIQIEFLKAGSAQKWLEALVLRHADRVRQIDGDLWVLAEREEAEA